MYTKSPRQLEWLANRYCRELTSRPNSRIPSMKILGIIPARGGSKGIPTKNVTPLLGKPLLANTAETALTSKRLAAQFYLRMTKKLQASSRVVGSIETFLLTT
jgi:Cytidylyltransferase